MVKLNKKTEKKRKRKRKKEKKKGGVGGTYERELGRPKTLERHLKSEPKKEKGTLRSEMKNPRKGLWE